MKFIGWGLFCMFTCGPALVLSVFSLVFSPFIVLAAASGRVDWMLGCVMFFCGIWGLLTSIRLGVSTARKQHAKLSKTTIVGLFAGLLASLIGLLLTVNRLDVWIWIWIFLGPVVFVGTCWWKRLRFRQHSSLESDQTGFST